MTTKTYIFEYIFNLVLIEYAPKKRKSLGVILSLIWMKNCESNYVKSRLKNKANKTKSDVDIAAYK